MYVWSTLSAEYDMDQPGRCQSCSRTSEEEKRGENDTFPALVRARECRLARQVCRSRPASACCSFPTLKGECGAYLRDSPSYCTILYLHGEQTAPALVESRACVRENCAFHFYGFLGFNRPLKLLLHFVLLYLRWTVGFSRKFLTHLDLQSTPMGS